MFKTTTKKLMKLLWINNVMARDAVEGGGRKGSVFFDSSAQTAGFRIFSTHSFLRSII